MTEDGRPEWKEAREREREREKRQTEREKNTHKRERNSAGAGEEYCARSVNVYAWCIYRCG